MTETQRKALQAAEDAFRRYSDHHAMNGDETKARANMALAGQMAAAQVECAAPVAAQIRHQDEDGQWSEVSGCGIGRDEIVIMARGTA